MKIYAIVVTYHPDGAALERLVAALHAGGAQVIVADNTPDGPPAPQGCIAISMGENTGIAKAQNAAIGRALAEGADVMIFFDQDSVIEPDLVQRLLAHLNTSRPGLIGPLHFDEREGFEYANYVLNRWGYPNQVTSNGREEPYPVDTRISSGSAITAQTFAVAGLFDEALFLDYVDIEWCLRARARGVPIRVDPAVSMKHSVGHSAVKVGPLTVFIDGPVRSYYRMRNAWLLLRRREVPKVFALKVITSEMVHQTIQLFVADQHRARFGAYLEALWHGLIGVGGRRAG
jgi:rhamnosyltransferase